MNKIISNETKALLNRYIERLMHDTTPDMPIWNIESIKQGKAAHWNYIDGCMITSLLNLYKITGDKKYLEFSDNFIDYYVFDDGSIRGFKKDTYNIDNINEGRVLFDLYKYTGKEKYRLAIETLYDQLKDHPRTKEGNFFHKAIYNNQIWLDGLYMGQPFYTLYAKHYDESKIDDIISQFNNVFSIMFDKEKELYYHGYDSSRVAFWCDKETGLSKNFWLRSIGWYTVALIDVYDFLEDDSRKEQIAYIFQRTIKGVLRYLDKDANMFYQVVDQVGRDGNYLETSGSAMIAYAILKGVRLSVLNKELLETGLKIFQGICDKYLSEENGELNLGGICLVAGLGPENNLRRDGSYEYYISEPIVNNDAKGVGPLIMAYTEVLRVI